MGHVPQSHELPESNSCSGAGYRTHKMALSSKSASFTSETALMFGSSQSNATSVARSGVSRPGLDASTRCAAACHHDQAHGHRE
eukprot:6211150-Pleurochrysis_carterae.AAC.1